MSLGSQSERCAALYRAKVSGLILYGRALGLSHNEAEDVLQETFMAMLKLPSLPENLEGYCIRTFRNRAFNFRRGLWRRFTRELESQRWFENEAPDPAEVAAIECLKKLPDDQREVVVLKIWNELTFQEIAELLAISPNTAAGRYRYGLEKLRTALKERKYEHERPVRGTITLLGATPPFGEA